MVGIKHESMRKGQTSHKKEHNTRMCFPLKPVFTRDKGGLPNFTDETMTEFVQPYLKRIRLLVDTLNARERTLFSIVSNITEHQRNFFLKDGRLEPFTLKEIAEELGMHESTISRAISNKSVRFKNREIPLKYFFISKTVNGDSKDCVEERIKTLIASEDKQHPLSDQKLSELMKKEGIVVARRTIAKYREQMGILPAAKRKVY